jgi:DNA-binding NarL/FixJ family response regulator
VTRNIPGTLGMREMAALYGTGDAYIRRAQQHRPTDPAAIEREILRLFASGLGVNTIATAMHLDPAAVRQALGPAPTTSITR